MLQVDGSAITIPESRLLEIDDISPEVQADLAYRHYVQKASNGEARVFEFSDGATYCVRYKDNYNGEEVSLLDIDNRGRICGAGTLWAFAYTVPSVGSTETRVPFRRQGLGLRRLHVMNYLAEEITGQLLHSASLEQTTPEAAAVWDTLVAQGRAEEYTDEVWHRYRFIVSSAMGTD